MQASRLNHPHITASPIVSSRAFYIARAAPGHRHRWSRRRAANVVSLDRWLITAFGRYSLEIVGYVEHARRLYACRELIWEAAAELLRRGTDVILDDGFFLRNDRELHIARARGLGAAAALHFIETPLDTLRARLAARKSRPGRPPLRHRPRGHRSLCRVLSAAIRRRRRRAHRGTLKRPTGEGEPPGEPRERRPRRRPPKP